MKISLNWLKEYINSKLSAKELAHRLTLSGLEVEKEEIVSVDSIYLGLSSGEIETSPRSIGSKPRKLGDDTVFELEITPNRPDCLSLIGIARELSAILNVPLKTPKVGKIKIPSKKCSIVIEDKKDCARYIGAILTDVKIAPSSVRIQAFLSAIGLRPVNNIVDITNFCLMETGQPMHAFDYDKLSGGKIVVRRAKPGEKLIAINDVEYTLDPSILVIADAERAVAIAGIMGGKATEVTAKTKNILLESASFDPLLIRRASRKLGLRSDASYRFERGVDMDMVYKGCLRAVSLMLEIASGTFTSLADVAQGKSKKQKPVSIVFDIKKATKLLGTAISSSQAKNILTKLECKVSSAAKGGLKVSPPSFRADIKTDVDVIEEIGRIIGFDRLSSRLCAINPLNIATDKKRMFKEKLATLLVSQGCSEIVSYTTLSTADLVKAKVSLQGLVYNQNFLNEDQEVMRPSCLPSMLNVLGHNVKNGQKNLRFFEIGKIYLPSGEKDVFVIGLTGVPAHDWRSPQTRKNDFYDIKGIVANAFEFFKAQGLVFRSGQHVSLDPQETMDIIFAGQAVGFLGKIKKNILSAWDIKHQDVFFAQIFIDGLCQHDAKRIAAYVPLNAYPSIVRDVSLALKKEISYQSIKEAIVHLREPLLKSIDFVEQYLGDKISPGQRGMTISLVYQSSSKTLTEQEVEEAHQRICSHIVSAFQAVKR
mgnify:CR=1 FL=1